METLKRWLVVVALLLVTLNLYFLVEDNKKPSYKYLKSKTVFVGQKDSIRGDVVGTGVVIAIKDGITYILTNNHICDGYENTSCYIINEEEVVRVVLLKTDKTLDLSLIACNHIFKEKTSIISLGDSKVQDNIYFTGNALGFFKYVYSEGKVSYLEEKHTLIIVPVMNGQSGSGVFNDRGELVGLINGELKFTGYSMFINSNTLEQFLGIYLTLKD